MPDSDSEFGLRESGFLLEMNLEKFLYHAGFRKNLIQYLKL